MTPNPSDHHAGQPLGKWAVRHPKHDMSEAEVLEWAQHTALWRLFPFGFWTEDDGSYVIFDMDRRPICRKKPDGTVEVLRATASIDPVAERQLYGDEGPSEKLTYTKQCLELVERLGICEEIEYRIAIFEKRGLPGGDI